MSVAAVAINMFCLCYAGAVISAVNDEMLQSYELAFPSGLLKLSDENISKVN